MKNIKNVYDFYASYIGSKIANEIKYYFIVKKIIVNEKSSRGWEWHDHFF